MHRTYYEGNKDRYLQRVRLKREVIRKLLERLKTGPCVDCGVSYPPYVMDFDHRDATNKKFSIAKADDRTSSIEKLLAEIAKCDLVCANCHRERTYGQLGSRLTVGQRPLKPRIGVRVPAPESPLRKKRSLD